MCIGHSKMTIILTLTGYISAVNWQRNWSLITVDNYNDFTTIIMEEEHY
jgi:hypothetical protein